MSPFLIEDEPPPKMGSNLWAQSSVVPDVSVVPPTGTQDQAGDNDLFFDNAVTLKSLPTKVAAEKHRGAITGDRLLGGIKGAIPKALRNSIDPLAGMKSEPLNHNLFADVSEMKKKIKESVHKPKYNVHNYYKDKGWVQAVVRHSLFEQIGLVVIASNALWIAYDTDYNPAGVLLEAELQFQIAENFFCTFFVSELFLRFAAFRYKMDCFRDSWFIFDTVLVLIMVVETWAVTLMFVASGDSSGSSASGVGDTSLLKMLRLVRLVRMGRMARLLRAIPELMILIKGIQAATRGVFFTLCLLIAIIYIFSIGFTQMTSGTFVGDKYFENVPAAILTLLLRGTYLDEITELVDDMKEENLGVILIVVFLFFVLLAAHTVVNMLIGVLCEVVSVVATTEKEELMVNFVASKLSGILDKMDQNHNHLISKTEFIKMLGNPQASRTLQDIGVDPIGLVDFADVIFPPSQNTLDRGEDDDASCQLTFEDFMDVILQFRGSNTATVKDLVEWQKTVRNTIQLLGKEMKNLEELIKAKFSWPSRLSSISSVTDDTPTSPTAGFGAATTLRSSSGSSNQNFRFADHKPLGSDIEDNQLTKPINKVLTNTGSPAKASRKSNEVHPREPMSDLITKLDGVMADPEGMEWVMSRVTEHIRSETTKRVTAEDSLKELKSELAALQNEVRRLRPPPPPGRSPQTDSQFATERIHPILGSTEVPTASAAVISQTCRSDLQNGNGATSSNEVLSQRFTHLVDLDQCVYQNLAGLRSSLADLPSATASETAVVDTVGHGLPGAPENVELQAVPNSSGRTHGGAEQWHGSGQMLGDPPSASSTWHRAASPASDSDFGVRDIAPKLS